MSSLQDQRNQLTDIGHSVTSLEVQLASLRSEQSTLFDGLSKVVYPILDIPREITSEIFLHTMSDIFVNPTAGLKRRHPHQLFPLQLTQMSRTGQRPLDLFIDLGNADGDMAMAEEILPVIFPSAHRWRRLHLLGSGTTTWVDFLRPFASLRHPLLLLEDLKIEGFRAPYVKPTGRRHSPFAYAPRLRELTIDLLSATLALRLPWRQLTTLDVSGYSLGPSKMVDLWINLESLTLRLQLEGGDPNDWYARPPVTLPRLHTLRCIGKASTEFLDALTLPALTSLTLSKVDDAFRVQRVLSCITRSVCVKTLCTLELDRIGPVAAGAYLAALPAVQHLKLVQNCWHLPHGSPGATAVESHRNRLFVYLASGRWLPALEKLTLERWPGAAHQQDLEYFVSILKQRRTQPGAKLCEFSLSIADDGLGKVLHHLDGLVASGLKVDVNGAVKYR
ncbi:hypothetical protein C8F01DRAFT_1079743 [Mycena amicta]|nr:hypothetical protein C8F01DRAFT_1079743 [Mycena amicta]